MWGEQTFTSFSVWNMRKYDGELKEKADEEYEFKGEYKYISSKYLNEIMSQGDEYQAMFKEYFEVSKTS